MTGTSRPCLRELRERGGGALHAWLVADAALVSAIERLGQLRATKVELLNARGISVHQLAQFRRWEQSAAKPAEYRTLAIYAQRRNIIASIDRRWDGTITTTRRMRGTRGPESRKHVVQRARIVNMINTACSRTS